MKMEVGERRERATVRVPFIREFYGIARRPVWRGVCACKARSFEPFIASKILGEKLGVSRGSIAKMADFKQKTGVFASKTPVLLVSGQVRKSNHKMVLIWANRLKIGKFIRIC